MEEKVTFAKPPVIIRETLVDFLKTMKVYKTTIPNLMNYSFPYSVRAMTGLLLHSWLSNYSHKQFCTDLTNIYLTVSPQPFDDFSKKDMLTQDCLVQMIDAHPDTLDVYHVGQHLMFCGFEYAFNGKKDTLYDTHLAVLRNKRPLVIRMEQGQIKLNVMTFQDSIDRLLSIVKEEDSIVFSTVTDNLEQYGYRYKPNNIDS